MPSIRLSRGRHGAEKCADDQDDKGVWSITFYLWRLFCFGVGDADGLVKTEHAIGQVFDEKGVKYFGVEKLDYGHDWSLWQINLQEFASKMFQPDK